MNTNIPAERGNPSTKEPPTGKNPNTTREPTQTKESTTLENPDKEIKETTPLNPIEFLPRKCTLQRQLAKQNIRKHRNKQKSHLKWGDQKKDLQ